MSDAFEHNAGDHEDPMAGPTWTVGIVGAILLVVTCLGVAALTFGVFTREREVKVLDQLTNSAPMALEELRALQLERLEGPPRRELRVDNVEGEESLVIPLDVAMSKMVEEASTP